MRSHSEEVLQLEHQDHSDYLISRSKDNSIRVWNSETSEQLFEFNYTAKDECVSISAHPTEKHIAGGFQSGIFRIFEIESVTVKLEQKYHNKSVEVV